MDKEAVSDAILKRRLKIIDRTAKSLSKAGKEIDGVLYPSGGIKARSISEWGQIVLAFLLYTKYCYDSGQLLEQIDDVLDRYGDRMSEEDKKALNELGEKVWEERTRRGCTD